MLKTIKYFFFLVWLVCAPAATSAKILCVPYGYQTIQNAVDAAQNGDVILVKPGIYIENIAIGGKGRKARSSGLAFPPRS